jgi:hypothetical protein
MEEKKTLGQISAAIIDEDRAALRLHRPSRMGGAWWF